MKARETGDGSATKSAVCVKDWPRIEAANRQKAVKIAPQRRLQRRSSDKLRARVFY
jgi:hypothetical protein